MIEWFTWVQLAVAVAAGVLCLVLGLAGRVPSDLTIGALALVELLLVVLERNRWSTVILGVAALAVGVMVYRMLQIWTVQSA